MVWSHWLDNSFVMQTESDLIKKILTATFYYRHEYFLFTYDDIFYDDILTMIVNANLSNSMLDDVREN